MSQTISMPPRKNKPLTDRHKPGVMVRIPQHVADLLSELAEEHMTRTVTAEVIAACHDYLVKHGRWPSTKK